jgi:Asp-tRNA(Asn)/Glu-tRNA(Gln) amidotransferase A subunit family amidase
MRNAGAEIVDEVAIDGVDPRLGPEYLKGFARRVDAQFARYPASRRDWRDVCSSGLIRPEWTAQQCIAAGASSPQQEKSAVGKIERNRAQIVAAMDRHRLDALLYPTDASGGAREGQTEHFTCFIAGTSGLPAAAFPVGLDARGMPLGLELMGRPNDDEAMVAMMAAFEAARGPLPAPRRIENDSTLATLDIARQNDIRRQLGWRAFKSRSGKDGKDIGALAPDRLRTLTDEVVKAARKQP